MDLLNRSIDFNENRNIYRGISKLSEYCEREFVTYA